VKERVSLKAGENGLAMHAYKVNFAVVMQRDAALNESLFDVVVARELRG
jgi:hypothetical protein